MSQKWFRPGKGKWHLLAGRRSACKQLAYSDAPTVARTRSSDRCKTCRRIAWGGGEMTTLGRQLAHHSLYPDHYVPRKPTGVELIMERILEHPRTLKIVVSLFGGYLVYHAIRFAVSQSWAMRIHQ